MTRRNTIATIATVLALAAITLLTVGPFHLAGHEHDEFLIESHCAVCVLATISGVTPDDACVSPKLAELGPVATHCSVFLATNLTPNDTSRAPPAV